jgi:nucleoside-diphosphate-sugar epimerase
MSQPKILILGSSGFVGHNIHSVLQHKYIVYSTTRNEHLIKENTIFFDLERRETWNNILSVKPDIVINAAGYGVVKMQKEHVKLQRINYYLPYLLKEFLDENNNQYFWMQIGTAFEYDLNKGALSEHSPAMPLTDYGISKLLFSLYLLQSGLKNFVILRPFAMFGPGEDESKIVPALIIAQKEKKPINLSDGEQRRDYFYVKDLALFLDQIITNGLSSVGGEIINIGSSQAISLKELADKISRNLPSFDENYWKWGAIEQRQLESAAFYNDSNKGITLGFRQTLFNVACGETINYYYQK